MKTTISAQLGQQLHLTPQLLQSIRLLQLDGMQLELEIRRALETNPLLELEELADNGDQAATDNDGASDIAAFDELPESTMWDVQGGSWNDGDDDRMQRVAAGESTDPHVRILRELALDLDEAALGAAAFWLEQTDDAGYLTEALSTLQQLGATRLGMTVQAVEAIGQRLLHGDPAGLAACDLRECLQAQLSALPGRVPARHLAARILDGDLELLAAHDYTVLACAHDAEVDDAREAVRLILSL
ncbi:RNA polymerase sigma-54 factor, partial [Xanthomonas perforans]|nr:RNA polymerase sigma-54 factor [Xanthomonas perforans]